MDSPKIGIIGVGMVGSQLARYFSEIKKLTRGTNLFLYDIDPKKDYFDDVVRAHVIFVCVPTPRSPDGSANLSLVESAIEMIDKKKEGGKIIVVKSTVPPGTTERLQKKYPAHQFVFNPEFLTESQAWVDMIRPDRQIVGYTVAADPDGTDGAGTKYAAATVLRLLPDAFFKSPSLHGCYEGHYLTATEAETGKIAANVFGATKVTFGNILADFCAALEEPASYENVRHILAHDGRIGPAWLDIHHGSYRGFGGYCFPKDLDAFIAYSDELAAKLKKKKDKKSRDLIQLLSKGLAVFKAIRSYNEALLRSQGYSVRQISTHEKDITL
ncbi:MAG: UDP-glucose/GDP-mannose dehydrogenase family protein [Candidatus Sungbacteria bacterium]|nr:UDP-glucose/GDP-mannose dehydrogenase family protein [Candidatus Sungbacteria bacterium]